MRYRSTVLRTGFTQRTMSGLAGLRQITDAAGSVRSGSSPTDVLLPA